MRFFRNRLAENGRTDGMLQILHRHLDRIKVPVIDPPMVDKLQTGIEEIWIWCAYCTVGFRHRLCLINKIVIDREQLVEFLHLLKGIVRILFRIIAVDADDHQILLWECCAQGVYPLPNRLDVRAVIAHEQDQVRLSARNILQGMSLAVSPFEREHRSGRTDRQCL